METLSAHRCFSGTLRVLRHDSDVTRCLMRFSLFTPDAPSGAAMIYLSGLTCTEENFTVKAGAYRMASEHGLTVIAPDTSPRGTGVPDAKEEGLGQGAGFYIDATEPPWSTHYRMESYVMHELLPLLVAASEVDAAQIGIMGHSMGGHGALTLAMKHPERFRSVSAIAPICSTLASPLARHAFGHYLGADETAWAAHDACALLCAKGTLPYPIMVDQGMDDPFLARLRPDLLEEAARAVGQELVMRRHVGYDHSYFFVQSVIDDHVRFHAR